MTISKDLKHVGLTAPRPVTKWTIGISFVLSVALTLYIAPWHRAPVTFYYPLIVPVEVIKGDRIVLSDNLTLVVDHDKRIESMSYDGWVVTINATRHLKIWEILSGG